MTKKIKYILLFIKYTNGKTLLNWIKKFFIILFFISLFTEPFISNNTQNYLGRVKKSIFKEIVSFEKNLNLSLKIFDEYRKINCANKLIEENQKFKKSDNPDVSVIITIHNQANDIHKSLRSVQNQSIKNIEIIIVDDCSLDNSLDKIKEYQKEDERILVISHDSNEGTIKSRADGIRKAKGKYITILDGDDAFIHKDILNNCLYIAQKASLDIIEFGAGRYVNEKFKGIVYNYENELINVKNIIYQPELRVKFFSKKGKYRYTLINRVIWGKFIKKNLFKELLNYIGSEYTNDYINLAEDTLMAVGIYHIAESYYVMKEIGYYYNSGEKKNFIILNNKKICRNVKDGINNFYFSYLKFLVDKHNKTKNERRNTYKEYLLFISDKLFDMNLKKRHYQIIFHVFNKLLEWNCLRQKDKKRIFEYKIKTIEKGIKDNIILINS